jgi:hypothetical protein
VSDDDKLKDRFIGFCVFVGLLFIHGGAIFDKTALVLAGFFWMWLARELDS